MKKLLILHVSEKIVTPSILNWLWHGALVLTTENLGFRNLKGSRFKIWDDTGGVIKARVCGYISATTILHSMAKIEFE